MRVAPFIATFLLFSSHAFLQQPPPPVTRDAQAVTLLQTSVGAMGGNVPSDSVATGSIKIVAGSQTSTGTIRILTRGTDQSSEQITLPEATRTVTYSLRMAE